MMLQIEKTRAGILYTTILCILLSCFISLPVIAEETVAGGKQHSSTGKNDDKEMEQIIGLGRFTPGSPHLRLAKLLLEVKEGKSSKYFFEEMAKLGPDVSMVTVNEVKTSISQIGGDLLLAKFLGERFPGKQGTPVETRLLGFRRELTIRAISEVAKMSQFRQYANETRVFLAFVGKWANQDATSFTFSGDIDFSFVGGNLEILVMMRDAFDRIIMRETGLTMRQIDSLATAHGIGTSDVYVGEAGRKYGDDEIKKGMVGEINLHNGQVVYDAESGQEAIRYSLVEEAVHEWVKKGGDREDIISKKFGKQGEPALSMEFVRHLKHDIISKADSMPAMDSIVKGCKYLNRSNHYYTTEFNASPADARMAKFAADITNMAKKVSPADMAKAIEVFFRDNPAMPNPFDVDYTSGPDGKPRAILKANRENAGKFLELCMENMWKNVQNGLKNRIDDLERRQGELEDRAKTDESAKKQLETLRNDMMNVVKGISTELEEFEKSHVEIPSEIKSKCEDLIKLVKKLTAKGVVVKLSLEEQKQLEMIKKLLDKPGESGVKMAAAAAMDLANKFVERTNARLDWLDDTLLGPLRGDPAFDDWLRDIEEYNKLKIDVETITDPRVKARISEIQNSWKGKTRRYTLDFETSLNRLVYQNCISKGVTKINVTVNEFIQSSQSGRAAMQGLTAFNLANEFSAYADAFSKEGASSLAAEIMRRRVPFVSAGENVYQGKYCRAVWEVFTTIFPPAALPEAAYGVVSYTTNLAVSGYWSSELEGLINDLYASAEFAEKEGGGDAGGRIAFKLTYVTYKEKKYEMESLLNGDTFILDPDVDTVLWANLAQNDPFLDLMTELQNHEAAGQKVKDRFIIKYEERWKVMKKTFSRSMVEKLEKRKNSEKATELGQVPAMYDELMNIAEKLQIKDQLNKTMDTQWDSNNLKALWTWLKNVKRTVLSQSLSETERNKATTVIADNLEIYKQVLASRTKVETEIAGVMTDAGIGAADPVQHNQRILTGIVFLTGNGKEDEEKARTWEAIPSSIRGRCEKLLLDTKGQTIQDAKLDTAFDRETLGRLFFEEVWIETLSRMKIPVISMAGFQQARSKRIDTRDRLIREYNDYYALASGAITVIVRQQRGKDKTEDPVVNASVFVKDTMNQETSLAHKGNGSYFVTGLKPGTYILSVSASEFAAPDGNKEPRYTIVVPTPKSGEKPLPPITVYLVPEDADKGEFIVKIDPNAVTIRESGQNSSALFQPIVSPAKDSGKLSYQWSADTEGLESNKDVDVKDIRPLLFSGKNRAGKDVKITLAVFDEKNRQAVGTAIVRVVSSEGLNAKLNNHRREIFKNESELIDVVEPMSNTGNFKYYWRFIEMGTQRVFEREWSHGYMINGADFAGRTWAVTVTVKDQDGRTGKADTTITVKNDDAPSKINVTITPGRATIREDGFVDFTVAIEPMADSGQLTVSGVRLAQGVTSYASRFYGKGHENWVPVVVEVMDARGRKGEGVAYVYVKKSDGQEPVGAGTPSGLSPDGTGKQNENLYPTGDTGTGGKIGRDVSAVTCSYEYSQWGECSRSTKKQTRFIIATKPFGCIERQKPVLEQGCTPPPTEQEKRHSYFNCLCRCSSGWAGHIGVWYDPEGKSMPESPSSGPCFGGAGAFGNTRRHYFIAPNDCSKGCWEGVYGKDTYDTALADRMRKEENKKFKQPLRVTLSADRTTIQAGETANISSAASGGIPGYTYAWSNAAGKEGSAQFTARRPGRYTVSLTVADSDGERATGSIAIIVEGLTVKIEKLEPVDNKVIVGKTAKFKATVYSGDKPATGTFTFHWQPHPEVTFDKFEDTNPQTTAKFTKVGTYKVWVNVLQKQGEVLSTLAESEQLSIEVIGPKWEIEITPKEFYTGQEVKARANPIVPQGVPMPDMKVFSLRWELSNAKELMRSQDDREITFYAASPGPVKIGVLVRSDGVDIGGRGITLNAKTYDVKISEPRYIGSKPKIWKCDTQLGGKCPGLVDVTTELVADNNLFMKATVSPTPEKQPLRYNWTISPEGCSIGNPISQEPTVNCREKGGYEAKVSVRDNRDIQLGTGARQFSITVSREDASKGTKQKEAMDKLSQAKGFVQQGKLDDAIRLAQEVLVLDPKNAEAQGLLNKLKSDKQNIQTYLGKAKQSLTRNKIDEAKQYLSQAKALHPQYQLVLDMEKQINAKIEEESHMKKEAANRLVQAKTLHGQGKLDEAIILAEEILKVDPTNTEARTLAASWKTDKQRINDSLNRAKQLLTQDKPEEAQKNITSAKMILPKYQPILDLEKAINQNINEKTRLKKEVADKVSKAKELMSRGKIDESITLIDEVLKLDPKNTEAKNLQEQIKEARNKNEKAKILLNEAVNLEKGKNYRKALEKYKEANALIPNQEVQKKISEIETAGKKAQALVNEGYSIEKQGDITEAIKRYKAAQDMFPNEDLAKRIRDLEGKYKEQQQKAQLAKDQQQKVKEEQQKVSKDQQQKNQLAMQARTQGEALQKQNKIPEAIAKYKEYLNLIPNDQAMAKYVSDLEGKYKEQQQKAQLAKDQQQKVKEEQQKVSKDQQQKNQLAMQARTQGEALQKQNKIPEAIAKYKEYLALVPNDQAMAKYVNDLEGKYKEQQQKAQTAREQQQKAKEEQQQKAQLAKEQQQKTKEEQQKANKEQQQKTQLAMQARTQGEALQKQNKIPEAIAKYKEYLALVPNDQAMAKYVNDLETKYKEQQQKAKEEQQKANKEQQQKKQQLAAQARSQGEALQKQNKIPEAIARYKEYLALVPNDQAMAKYVSDLEGKYKEQQQKAQTAKEQQQKAKEEEQKKAKEQQQKAEEAQQTDISSLTAMLENKGSDDIHIFVNGQDKLGPQNKLAPLKKRQIKAKLTSPGSNNIKFVALRNGKQIAWCSIVAQAGQVQKQSATVTFIEPDKLTCKGQ